MGETCKMNSRSDQVDRISVLPKIILDSVLTRLPIREAVRTSILSRSWKCQWHYLSEININFKDLPHVSPATLVKIVDHVLLVHCGSIEKFRLIINLGSCNDIDRWILYLSRNSVKELTINKRSNGFYDLPSYIFSCSDLTYLELTSCIIKPPPASFIQFSKLINLDFTLVGISSKELENLLNSCPLLSRLSLMEVHPRPSIKINAPNLVMFYINGFDCYPQFMDTPLLTSAIFASVSPVCSNTPDNQECKILELLGSMPTLERLEFDEYAFQRLAVGHVPVRLPLACPVKQLIIYINLEDLQELLAAFCIFRSTPFMRTLEITASSNGCRPGMPASRFWIGEDGFSFKFDHLEEVAMICCVGTKSELRFIKFVLASAPALRTMRIRFDEDVKGLLGILVELNRLPRISPIAQIEVDYYEYEQ